MARIEEKDVGIAHTSRFTSPIALKILEKRMGFDDGEGTSRMKLSQ